MNTAEQLLAEMSARGVRVESDGQSLRYFAPTGIVPGELRARLSEHREQVIEALKYPRGSCSSSESTPVAPDWPTGWIKTVVITFDSGAERPTSVEDQPTATERFNPEGE